MKKLILILFSVLCTVTANAVRIVSFNDNGKVWYAYKLEQTDTICGYFDKYIVVRQKDNTTVVLYDYLEHRGLFMNMDKIN